MRKVLLVGVGIGLTVTAISYVTTHGVAAALSGAGAAATPSPLAGPVGPADGPSADFGVGVGGLIGRLKARSDRRDGRSIAMSSRVSPCVLSANFRHSTFSVRPQFRLRPPVCAWPER